MPDLNAILDSHSYLPYVVLLVWTFLEGETIVILAGIAAQDGTPWLPLVILCSFCGSLCSDQLAFFLGRYKGKAFIARRPSWQKRAERVYRMLERHQTLLILGFRFLYGLRNVTPFAIGMSEVPTRRFVTLNVIGAAVWATTFACVGYAFGAAVSTLFAKHEQTVKTVSLLAVAGILTLAWIVRLVRRRQLNQREKARLALEAQDAETGRHGLPGVAAWAKPGDAEKTGETKTACRVPDTE